MRAAQRAEVLPPSLPPVGISREQAAARELAARRAVFQANGGFRDA